MEVVRRVSFIDDLTESYAYLAAQSPSAANRLLDENEATVARLAAFPQLGRLRPELGQGVRSFRLRGFAQILFYRQTADRIVLLRLLHGARRIRPELSGR